MHHQAQLSAEQYRCLVNCIITFDYCAKFTDKFSALL